ncbi:hypothetical protein NHX12_006134 [Muraenolepis orangiensis]|uniref:Uncharacterized protein n=1 Tax=Muraenolepis orangiensis TaxID=630683 RepID=A0A9Q0D5I8_9TELE|nr:hypothetical protein NHX12_017395 [Muraenolepis orangiensis]KAJ3593800.1 hypothetical protein NHX12_006134 [Muraenolepis orangiensis]
MATARRQACAETHGASPSEAEVPETDLPLSISRSLATISISSGIYGLACDTSVTNATAHHTPPPMLPSTISPLSPSLLQLIS